MRKAGADAPMSPDQAVLLRQLAVEAYEPDAFAERITRSEAELRIAMLRQKLNRIGGATHIL